MRIRRTLIAATVAVGALSLGLFGGAAVASIPAVFSPDGLSLVDNSADTVPMPDPDYQVNQNGSTFGSIAEASSPSDEPDLIEAVATNGRTGYVYKTDLDAANGTTAAESFKTPEDARKWQATRGDEPVRISVYESDGLTVLGEFEIVTAVDIVEIVPKG